MYVFLEYLLELVLNNSQEIHQIGKQTENCARYKIELKTYRSVIRQTK